MKVGPVGGEVKSGSTYSAGDVIGIALSKVIVPQGSGIKLGPGLNHLVICI